MKKFILTGLTAALMSANVMASEVVEGTDTTVLLLIHRRLPAK